MSHDRVRLAAGRVVALLLNRHPGVHSVSRVTATGHWTGTVPCATSADVVPQSRGTNECPTELRLGPRVSPTTPMARILEFISHTEQLHACIGFAFSRFMKFNSGRAVEAPDERRKRLADENHHRAKEWGWAQRHGPVGEGAVLLAFPSHSRPASTPKRASK